MLHLPLEDSSLPFFKILKRVSWFQWDEHCMKAFWELKYYLGELQILTKPYVSEKLWVYLAMSIVVMSIVLVRQEEGEQYPICNISNLFEGVELHYTSLKKLTMGLTLTARRLRPYFLSYRIMVLTDTPLGHILSHPEAIGRLIK